jgi:DNA-binding LacI/PurR family transcriptional regulator
MPVAEPTFDRSLLYERVREELRSRCAQPAGTALPSLREMSRELDVNYVTVLRALRDLEEEGLVEIVPRKGIYVRGGETARAGKNIELVTFYFQQEYILDISSHILRGMEDAGGTGILHSSTLTVPPFPDAKDFIRTLQQRQVGAVLFLGVQYLKYPHSLDEANFLREIAAQIPSVTIGHPHQIVALDCVYADPRPQLREYLEQCYSKGLRRFGFLGVHPRVTIHERFELFKDFLLERRLEWDDRYALTYHSTADEDTREYFNQTPLPEVLVTVDSYALLAAMEAHRRGIKLGEEMHIVTISSHESRMLPLLGDITVILADEDEVGKRAYQLAQRKLLEPREEHEPVIERVPGRFLNNLLEQ